MRCIVGHRGGIEVSCAQGGGPLLSPNDAIAMFSSLLRERAVERVLVAYLDDAKRVLRIDVATEGNESAAELPVAMLIRGALGCGAAGIMLAHNHPGGDPRPSLRDCVATRSLATAAHALDIALVDHIVIARDGAFSFRREGLL